MVQGGVLGPSTAQNVPAGKTIEDIYQKKTQLEHILLRPDTYVGSTERQDQKLWVHDGEGLVHKEISYVPGLYKIFDEILVNAADNKVRDASMDIVKVVVDQVSSTLQPDSCMHKRHLSWAPGYLLFDECASGLLFENAMPLKCIQGTYKIADNNWHSSHRILYR